MVENNDRRYAPIGMSDKKPKSENIEYYNQLYKAVMNPMVQRKFFTMLVNRDLSNYDGAKIPQTHKLLECKEVRYENLVFKYLVRVVTERDFKYGYWYEYREEGCEPIYGSGRSAGQIATWYAREAILDAYREFAKEEINSIPHKITVRRTLERAGWSQKDRRTIDGKKNIPTNGHTGRQTHRRTGRQTERQACGRQCR